MNATTTHRPVTAAVAFRRRVPYGRRNGHRKMGVSVAQVLEVVDGYGKGEHDGLVTVRVVLVADGTTRTITVLAEDIRLGDGPIDTLCAASRWHTDKYGTPEEDWS